MRPLRRRLLRLALEVGALLALHAFLLRWLATEDVVASILAAGSHVEWWKLALAMGFVGLRVVVLVGLWGAVAASLVLLLLDRLDTTRRDSDSRG